MLPDKLQSLLQSELQPGERVLWSGRPPTTRLFQTSVPGFGVGLLITGFFTLMLACMAASASQIPDASGDIPFVVFLARPFMPAILSLLAFCMMTAPWWICLCNARRTVYAVTSRRALILRPKLFGGHETRFFMACGLQNISTKESANGFGDIILTHDLRSGEQYNDIRIPVGFLGIPDVRNVEKILLKMRDENLRATTPNS